MQKQIEISGVTYIILGQREFSRKGAQRTELSLRKPNGRKVFHAIVYENGAVSEAV